MGVLPLAGFAFLVGHRVVTWRRLLDRVTERHRKGYSVSLYKAPWRTFIAVYALGNTYYVPLMRDQRVESLEPVELLLPLAKPKPRAQIPFLVDGTDRVVWPGGGCHTSVWPVGHMVFTVLRVFGPMILIPLTHWVGTSLPPC